MIKDSSLVITNYNSKIKLLKHLDPFLDIKFYLPRDYKAKYIFSHDAYLKIKELLNLPFEIIDDIKDYLYYINEENALTSKLKELLKVKNILLKEELIKEKVFLKKDNIYVYEVFDSYFDHALNILDDKKESNVSYYSFLTLHDELEYLFTSISKLLDEGALMKDIKIVAPNEYDDIHLYSKLFNIPVSKPKIYYKDLPVGISLIKALKNNTYQIDNFLGKDIVLDNFLKEFSDLNSPYLNELILYNFDNLYKTEDYEEKIEGISLVNAIGIKHLFILGFNEGTFVPTKKDVGYLKDSDKALINMPLSYDDNIDQNELIKYVLTSSENIYVSFKMYHAGKTYLRHHLGEEGKDFKVDNYYSKPVFLMNLTKALDNFYKYNIDSHYLSYKDMSLNKYNTYDNNFKGQVFVDYKRLSFSRLDTFNKCNFRYYVDNILKLSSFEENIYQKIGQIFHLMMEEDISFDKAIQNYQLDSKEFLILNNLKQHLEEAVSFNKEFNKFTEFKEVLHEKSFEINLRDGFSLYGIADGIYLKKEDDKTLIGIIDYKTGSIQPSLKYLNEGVNIQLLIYWYLIKQSNEFKNPVLVGAYFQEVLKIKHKKYFEERSKSLRYKGFSVTNIDNLESFSSDLKHLTLSYNKNGTLSKTSGEQIEIDALEEIEDAIEKMLDKVIDIQLGGKYQINPLKDIGCLYCKYHDICFRKKGDKSEAEDELY